MTRSFTKGFAILAAVAMAVGLAACGGSSKGGNSSAANTSGPAPKGVTLTVWHISGDSPALLNLYKAYEKESGNKINLVTIPNATFPMTVQTKWATGARPDLMELAGNLSDLVSLNPVKNMVDLSALDFVKKEGDLAKVSGTLDGKTYGATLGPISIYGIYYNKKVLAAAGLKPPKSYADLSSICSTLKSKAPTVAPLFEAGGSGFPQSFLAGFDYLAQYNVGGAYAAKVVAKKVKLNDADSPLVASMKAYTGLRDNHCFNSDYNTAKFENSFKALLAGKAAMVSSLSDFIPLIDADANGDTAKVDATVGFAAVSATKPVANFSASPQGTYYVPKTGNAKRERAATDFIQFVTGAGYQAYINDAKSIPTLTGATTPKLQQLWKDVQAVTPGAGLAVNAAIPGFGPWGQETGKLLAGQQSPQQTADNMQKYFEAAQAAIGGK